MNFLKRITSIFITLWGVVTVVFYLLSVLPGDPARMMLGQNENQEELQLIQQKYGFDQPIFIQYLNYLNDLSPISAHPQQHDFNGLSTQKYTYINLLNVGERAVVLKLPYLRESYHRSGVKVSQVIRNTLPNTAILAITALLIAISFGLFFGILSAIYSNSNLDRVIQLVSTLGMSVPSFFSAILVAWIFGFLLHQYTSLDMTGSLYALDDMGESYRIVWKNLILPAFVLGIRPLAVVSQLMRNALLDEWNRGYVKTARAKGLSTSTIILKHMLKNALNPVITALSGWFASMLAGAVFVEYIFGWNGIGKEIVNALNFLDIPVLMGSVITVSFFFIIINQVVDLLYAYLDPKVQLNKH
ncbi:MAG: ABC transporter permease [Bacteroidota bacterium]|nr:ABC transporter permease [Bacteroidota bacterium]